MAQELTVQECHSAIRRALGGEPKQRPMNALVNEAGEWFTSARNWKFLEGAVAYLDLTSNQPYVDLPTDVMAVQNVMRAPSFGGGFELVSREELLRLLEDSATVGTVNAAYYWGAVTHRQRGSTGTLTRDGTAPAAGEAVVIDTKTYTFRASITSASVDGDVLIGTADASLDNLIAAVGLTGTGGTDYADAMTRHDTCSMKRTATTTAQAEALTGGEAGDAYVSTTTIGTWTWTAATLANGGGVPTVRLDLYPTPNADAEDALVFHYRRGWAVVSSDTTFISLPSWCQTAFLQACRAFARGYEDDAKNPVALGKYLLGLQGSPYWAACVRRDGGVQAQYGTLRNGIATHGGPRRVRRGGWTTEDPS